MPENEALMEVELVGVFTDTSPFLAYQVIPEGWFGALITVMEQYWVEVAAAAMAKVPVVGGAKKLSVTVTVPFTPCSVVLKVDAQVGLLQPVPPTIRFELLVAGLVSVAVPVTVGLPGKGLPPVPPSSL